MIKLEETEQRIAKMNEQHSKIDEVLKPAPKIENITKNLEILKLITALIMD